MVRKAFLTIALAFACLIGMAQSSITGHWTSEPVNVGMDKIKAYSTLEYDFRDDGTFTEYNICTIPEIPIKGAGSISTSMKSKVEGTYVVLAGELRLKYDPKTSSSELGAIELKGAKPAEAEQFAEAEKRYKSMFSGMIDKEVRKTYKRFSGIKKNFTLEGSTFSYINESGHTYTFSK